MKEHFETNFIILLNILIVIVFFFLGHEMAERKHCAMNGGDYSFDYGKCVSLNKNKKEQ